MNIILENYKNDWKKNKAGNMALLLFMSLSAFLAAAAVIIVTRLFASIGSMYETARPPHFLQMHKGGLEQDGIDDLNKSFQGITHWQTVEMIDVYGEELHISNERYMEENKGESIDLRSFDLSECRLDIGIVKQNEEFDLLLDENRNRLRMEEGEIGIPVILLDSFDIRLGDMVTLNAKGIAKEFRVTAFVYDAQMNSTLCSSTRMLVSDEDFNSIIGNAGETEYLIEVYFEDTAMAEEYRLAYESEKLPANGQAVTYNVIFLLSAFTDILVAMVIILVGGLLVLIALLCVKYAVLASMEEELKEIGTMKAIGFSYEDIRGLYLNKIKLLAAAGCLCGMSAAYICAGIFTGHISRTFGKQAMHIKDILIPAAAGAVVYGVIIFYAKKLLKKLKSITVVDALVLGRGLNSEVVVRSGLYKSRHMTVNLLLALREVGENFKGYFIIAAVTCVISILVIIPMNILGTMKAEEFITYMGSTLEDIRIEAPPGAGLEERHEKINSLLMTDSDVQEYSSEKRIRVMTQSAEGEEAGLHIDIGNNAGEGLNYLLGSAPCEDSDIALSSLNADSLGRSVGDLITLRGENGSRQMRISGIYQDITSGGYTAKAVSEFENEKVSQYAFTISLREGADETLKAAQWSKKLGGGCAVRPMEEFCNQTLGGAAKQVETVVWAVGIIGIILAAGLMFLFTQMRFAKDASWIAAMKAFGFSVRDIRLQYLYKVMLVAGIGVFAGTLSANLLGDNLVSFMFGGMGFGISKFVFMGNVSAAYIGIPVLLFAAVSAAMWQLSRKVSGYSIVSLIQE